MHKDELSLEELSAATGMTARNVRAYQTKGLIPPPARTGRRSVYGLEHLNRLQAIERARRQGASLSLIAAHLAAGQPLDEDTLIGWQPSVPDPPDPLAPPERAGPCLDHEPGLRSRSAGHQDVAPLLARLDIQRDPAARSHLDELVEAGVFRPVGRQMYTGRELAEALTALQREGFPLQAALGIAQRALQAAIPLATALREAAAEIGGTTGETGLQLGQVAYCVLRHLIVGEGRLSSGLGSDPDSAGSAERGDEFDLDG